MTASVVRIHFPFHSLLVFVSSDALLRIPFFCRCAPPDCANPLGLRKNFDAARSPLCSRVSNCSNSDRSVLTPSRRTLGGATHWHPSAFFWFIFFSCLSTFFCTTRVKILFSGSRTHPSSKKVDEKKKKNTDGSQCFLFYFDLLVWSSSSLLAHLNSLARSTFR